MELKELAEMERTSKPRKRGTVWNKEYANDHEAMETMYKHAVTVGGVYGSDHVEQQLGQFVRKYMQHKYQLTLYSLLEN